MSERYRFGPFVIDLSERRLSRSGTPVDLNPRYFDALHLLVSQAGSLVTKDRFHSAVWKGVPVTDEALTQCVRSLRRALGDDAGSPTYIETVQRHGYRFIAPVSAEAPAAFAPRSVGPIIADTTAAAIGGGVAGLVGGAFYASTGLVSAWLGAASTLLAFMSLCLILGSLGGAAVGLGMALGGESNGRRIAGGAAGGLLIGALAGVVGKDLLLMLFGRAPTGFTGPAESATIGLATGLAVSLSQGLRRIGPTGRLAASFALGGAGGAIIAWAGGGLLAASLAKLVSTFPETLLRLDGLIALGLPMATAFEGALFAGFVSAALLVQRRLADRHRALLRN